MNFPFINLKMHNQTAKLDNVNYKLNEYGYRSKYSEIPDQRYFLTIGCSHTFGQGIINEKNRYSNIVEEKTGIPNINLGLPGGSHLYIQQQFHYAYDVCKQYRYPAAIIIQWPEIYRNFLYSETTKDHQIETPRTKKNYGILEKIKYDGAVLWEFKIAYAAVHGICKRLEIPLIEFSLYSMHLHYQLRYDAIDYQISKVETLSQVDLGSDNSHPGHQSHQLMADFLINRLSDEKII